MLNVSKPAPDRLNLELSGEMNAEVMRTGLETLLELSEGISEGKMLYRILDFEMPTPGAFAVELQLMPKLFSLIGRFNRCAVLVDTEWIRTAAEIEGALFPSLEIKSFPLAAMEAAEDWLEGGDVEIDPGDDDADDDEEENFPV